MNKACDAENEILDEMFKTGVIEPLGLILLVFEK